MKNQPNGGFLAEMPELNFTDEEKEIIGEYASKLQTASLEFATNYVMSADKTGDAAWAEWLLKAEQLGAKEIEKVYNEAQKRYDAQ